MGIESLKNIINKLEIIYIYKTLQQLITEYMFLSSAYHTYSEVKQTTDMKEQK